MIPVTQNADGSLTFQLGEQKLGPMNHDANSITIEGVFVLPADPRIKLALAAVQSAEAVLSGLV